MNWAAALQLALRALWRNKSRAALTALGVIIGVMFLIVVVSVVEGMDRYVRADFSCQVLSLFLNSGSDASQAAMAARMASPSGESSSATAPKSVTGKVLSGNAGSWIFSRIAGT